MTLRVVEKETVPTLVDWMPVEAERWARLLAEVCARIPETEVKTASLPGHPSMRGIVARSRIAAPGVQFDYSKWNDFQPYLLSVTHVSGNTEFYLRRDAVMVTGPREKYDMRRPVD